LHVTNLQNPNSGFGDPSGGSGFPAGFIALFVIVIILGVGVMIRRIAFTRQMAQKAGLSSGEATAVAMLGGTLVAPRTVGLPSSRACSIEDSSLRLSTTNAARPSSTRSDRQVRGADCSLR
jgi:hypothetical protein